MKTYRIKLDWMDIMYGRLFDRVKDESVVIWKDSEKIAIDAIKRARDGAYADKER